MASSSPEMTCPRPRLTPRNTHDNTTARHRLQGSHRGARHGDPRRGGLRASRAGTARRPRDASSRREHPVHRSGPMSKPVVGIDLGTTNSVVATVDDRGNVVILPNASGGELNASVVY